MSKCGVFQRAANLAGPQPPFSTAQKPDPVLGSLGTYLAFSHTSESVCEISPGSDEKENALRWREERVRLEAVRSLNFASY